MADQYINKTGLQYFFNRIKTLFASQTEVAALSEKVDDIISEGGEPNKINTVKVNGTALTPDSERAVNIECSKVTMDGEEVENLSIYTVTDEETGDIKALEFHPEDATNGYAVPTQEGMEAYVQGNGGKIDAIKVNGTEQTIANKTVDITAATITYQDESQPGQYRQQEVYIADKTNSVHLTGYIDESGDSANETLMVELPGSLTIALPSETYVDDKITNAIPTDVSAFQNDANYQTDAQVQDAIDAALEGITGIDFQVVDELPTTGAHGVIYLVHKGGAADDIYDEYIWVTPAGGTAHYEQIGTTQVDLSEYWAKEDLTALTTAEIDEILGA